MAWTEVITSDNTWAIQNNLYVVAGYWEDGYVVDTTNTWLNNSESSNTWIVIG
jgi:hypothetical protein